MEEDDCGIRSVTLAGIRHVQHQWRLADGCIDQVGAVVNAGWCLGTARRFVPIVLGSPRRLLTICVVWTATDRQENPRQKPARQADPFHETCRQDRWLPNHSSQMNASHVDSSFEFFRRLTNASG